MFENKELSTRNVETSKCIQNKKDSISVKSKAIRSK